MAKVSELKEQGRAFEVQGEIAKALATYRHILTHLQGTPALKAELPLYVKCGDLLLKLGDAAEAVGMYETVAEHFAAIGSTKSVLTIGQRIYRAAPDRTGVYLALGRRMVECGHAANAVPVLVEHAKQVGHAAMLEVLGPLAGKADSEARPVLEGLLATVSGGVTVTLRSSGASLVQPVGAVPDLVERPPAPPPPTPSAPSPEPVEPMTPPMIELAGPFAIPESAVPPPAPEPPLPFAPPPPITPEPLVPTSAALPSPSSLGLDLSPPLPPSTLESAAIDMRRRALRTSQETFLKSVPPPERAEPPPVRKRASGARRSVLPPPRRSRALLWVGFAVIVVGIAGGLVYFGVVPIGPVETVRAPAPRVPTRPKRAPPPPKRAAPARARADSIVPPSPGSIPTPSRPAATRANRPPPVYIQGLTVDSYSGTTRNGAFRLLQRQSSGERITLIGSPLANVVGEPAVGEVRLGSLGDTAIVTTNFAGYLIRLRGVVAPATLQALVGKLVSTPSNE